jgi:alpha-L-rhamnosidase
MGRPFALAIVAAVAAAAASGDVLLSLDAPVVALFSGAAANLTADSAAGGAGWVTTSFTDVPDHALFPEFVDVDLGACGLLSSVALFGNANGTTDGFPTQFAVFVSDAVLPRWRLALNVSGAHPSPGAPASFSLAAGAFGRFVRLSVTRVSGMNLTDVAAVAAASAPPRVRGAALAAQQTPSAWAAVRRLQVFGPPPSPAACPSADPNWPPAPPACSPAVRSISVHGLRADADASAAASAVIADTPAPRIAWTLAACERGQRVSAWQVLVGSAPGASDAWDSGVVNAGTGAAAAGANYAGAPLRQATLYFVTVVLFDATGTPTPPRAARFLTAKLTPTMAAWSGAWVGAGANASAHRAVYLRSSFELPAGRAVLRAVATFAGLGYGELSLDGAKLGDALLAPGWTQYNVRTQYLALEVDAALLTPGLHELGIVLGDGWYAISHDPWVHHLEDAVYVSTPKALLDLEVTFADGGREVFCTLCNSTAPWTWSDGEITRAWIGAENIDARLASVRNWRPAAAVPGPNEQFPGGLLVEQVELPTRVQGSFAPQLHKVVQTQPEPYIGGGEFAKAADAEMVFWVAGAPSNATAKYMLDPGACQPCPAIDACGNLVIVSDAYLDALPTAPTNFSCSMLPVRNQSSAFAHIFSFGREFQGFARLTLAGPSGANATLLFCGSMYGDCDETTLPSETGGPDLSTFTLAGTGAPESWLPRFMYTSVRTLVVKHDASIDPASVTVEGLFVSMDVDGAGATFASSDATYTWLHNTVVRTQENYITGMPNDPTREKKGWTQDVMTMAPTALLVHGTSAQRMYQRWVSDILDNEASNGELPEVAPGPVLNDGYNGAWWGGMGVFGPALLYGFSGDAARDLAPRYAAMRSYVVYLNSTADAGTHNVDWGLGDWLAVSADCMHNGTLINTPALALYAGLLSDAAALLAPSGVAPPGDAALFAALSASVRDSYFAQFWDGAALAPGEQCTQALALGLELGLPPLSPSSASPAPFTPAALRPAVERALLTRLAADAGVLTTGFVSFGFMLAALADLAPAAGQAVLMQRGAGASGPWLNSAGSSNSLCKEQWDGGDAEMPSLCGPLAAWSFYSLAGLRPPGAPASSASAAFAAAAPVASTAGWDNVIVKPNVGSNAGGVTFVDAAFEAPLGAVRVSWTLLPTPGNGTASGRLHLLVAVPPGASGLVHVPTLNAASVLEGGRPAASQPGVTFVVQAGDRAVFSVVSGEYAFEADFSTSSSAATAAMQGRVSLTAAAMAAA